MLRIDSGRYSFPYYIAAPDNGVLLIQDRNSQLAQYSNLQNGSFRGDADASCFSIGHWSTGCDQYDTGFPSDEARIYLENGKATNGALLWGKLILIQGPHNRVQIEHLWRIACENQVAAIVRLGPIKSYMEYRPCSDSPLKFDDLAIRTQSADTYLLESEERVHKLSYHAYENWDEFAASSCEEVYELILELEQLEYPIMIHCRGGFGRTGTFAACWKVYQEFKSAVEKGGQVEINPARIVAEIRSARTSTVQNALQFNMILDFVDYLNLTSISD